MHNKLTRLMVCDLSCFSFNSVKLRSTNQLKLKANGIHS